MKRKKCWFDKHKMIVASSKNLAEDWTYETLGRVHRQFIVKLYRCSRCGKEEVWKIFVDNRGGMMQIDIDFARNDAILRELWSKAESK